MRLATGRWSGGVALIVSALLVIQAACGGESPTASSPTGSVQVNVETTGHDLDPDGYAVVVGGQPHPVAANGQVTIDGLAEGAVSVELTGVAPNCAAQGSNPRALTVVGKATVMTTFQVVCLGTGSLQVTVVTTGEDLDMDGYTVEAGDSVRALAASAVVTVGGLLEGDVSVLLKGVALNCQVTGSNPRTVTIVFGTTVDVAFDITCAKTSWHVKTSMPTARLGLAAAEVNGVIYAIGGYPDNGTPALATVEAYDPMTDTWVSRAAMPTARRWLSAAAVNGIIYVIGGRNAPVATAGLTTVEAYDPLTNTWATRSDIPTGRVAAATAVVGGKIYVVGGGATNDALLATVEEYDPATDTWSPKQDMPTARAGLALEVAGGKLYAIGGGHESLGLPTVEVYDPATDTWTSLADMEAGRSFLCSGLVDGRIYAIGGRDSQERIYSTVRVYDPAADTWGAAAAMPSLRDAMSCATVNGRIYAVGGNPASFPPFTGLATVEEFDPSVP